jgi:hypothetical protein
VVGKESFKRISYQMMNIRKQVDLVEQAAHLQEGTEERFNGYGLMGMTFSSGHVLALRRFARTSLGSGYIAVWHRNPAGEWTIYTDVAPSLSCPRYFGEETRRVISAPIEIIWMGDNHFQVTIKAVEFSWDLILLQTRATAIMNFAAGMMPDWAWKKRIILKLMGKVAGPLMRIGKVNLSGYVPNGQYFIANPYKMWMVGESHASMEGEDFGFPGPLKSQPHYRDFRIPQRGVFALGRAYFEPFNKNKHSTRTSLSQVI